MEVQSATWTSEKNQNSELWLLYRSRSSIHSALRYYWRVGLYFFKAPQLLGKGQGEAVLKAHENTQNAAGFVEPFLATTVRFFEKAHGRDDDAHDYGAEAGRLKRGVH
jgi:hypothetical protein